MCSGFGLAHNFPSGLHFLVLNAKSNKANCVVLFLSFLLKCALHPMLTLCYCVFSLIGKKVFTVPKESLDGVENVLAICDAGQLDNKVLFLVYSSFGR